MDSEQAFHISGSHPRSFISGGGEMGELIRKYDWTLTPLGMTELWPESLRSVLNILLHSKFPMFLWWGNDLIQFYNDAYRPSLGNDGKHPQALGQRGEECWQEIWPVIHPLIQQVRLKGESMWLEDQLLPIFRNGTLEDVYWTFSYSPVYDGGEIAGVLVTCTETTEKVQTILKLRESEDQLKFAIEAAGLGTWDYNPLTAKFTANDRLKSWFGLPPESEIELSRAIEVIAERDKMRVAAAIQTALQFESGGQYDIEYAIIHPETQEERIVKAKGRAMFDDSQTAYRFNGTLQDITLEAIERKNSTDSELRLRSVIESAPFPIGLYAGPEMTILLANETMVSTYGKGSDVIGKSYKTLLPELGSQQIFEQIDAVRTTGIPFHAHNQRVDITIDNVLKPHYFNYSFLPVFDSEGKIYAVMNTAANVTDLIVAQQKTEEEKERTNLAIAAGELGVFEVNLETNTITANKRFNEIYGFEETMKREDYIALCHPDDLSTRSEALEEGMETGIFEYESRYRRENGITGWLKSKGRILYDERNKPIKLFGVIQDITEQKTFAESLARQVQERTVELHRSNDDLMQFAHVASHDLKEPVRKIKTFAGRMKDEFEEAFPEKAKIYLQKINNASDRMFSMIDGVLSYSTLSSSQQPNETVNLNALMLDIESDLEVPIQQKRAVFIKQQLPEIEGSAVLLYQLFYNLVNNSLKFSRPDVAPVIRLNYSTGKKGDEQMARITICDNGIGIEQDYAKTIFNAFTRLNPKDAYEGTGLGLALCKKITERHNGFITAAGLKDEGTIFTVLLPFKQNGKTI